MYSLIVALFMFVLPLVSVVVEMLVFHSTSSVVMLVGKWWTFWGVGMRLFTAGLRQVIQPRFTAEEIFHFKTTEALILIQELGYANIAMGITGLLAVSNSVWVVPGAIAGAVFYGLAGIRHVFKPNRDRLENIAMVSDLWMAAILLIFLVLVIVRPA